MLLSEGTRGTVFEGNRSYIFSLLNRFIAPLYCVSISATSLYVLPLHPSAPIPFPDRCSCSAPACNSEYLFLFFHGSGMLCRGKRHSTIRRGSFITTHNYPSFVPSAPRYIISIADGRIKKQQIGSYWQYCLNNDLSIYHLFLLFDIISLTSGAVTAFLFIILFFSSILFLQKS